MLVDTHCHLDHFDADEQTAVVERAHAAGIGWMVTIGTRFAQAAATKAIADRFASVFATVGIHPHNVAEEALPTADALAALADHPRVVGIGESGLDYFYDKAPRDLQAESFRRHIRAARRTGLPLVVHARDADADIAAILEAEHAADGPFRFVLHCFSSGAPLAERAIALGGYVSFSGILTFPKSDALRDIARRVPAERLLVETDSPYLAPVPLRGKRCEPGYVAHTAAVLARVRGLGSAELATLTTANAATLFDRR